MLPSHVAGGFWLGIPKSFCDSYLPKDDVTVVLVDKDDQKFNKKYLDRKTGLSGGWKSFSIAHKLLAGDVLVFQLIEHWKMEVEHILNDRLQQFVNIDLHDVKEARKRFDKANILFCMTRLERSFCP